MNENTTGVKPPAVPEAENDQNVENNDVKKDTGGTVAKDVYESVRDSMQKERAEKREAQLRVKELEALQTEPQVEADDVMLEKRVLQSEANSLIAIKLAKEPGFAKRMSLVEDEMRSSGKSLEEADASIKAKLYDQMAQSEDQPATLPNQLNSTAIPEQTDWKPSGDAVKDLMDNPQVDDALKRSIQRKFGA